MAGDGPLLICYDGSDSARAALDAAAELFEGEDAVVACFWQPFAAAAKRFSINILELVQNADGINAREEALARQIAEEGATEARGRGLTAEANAIRIDAPIDEAILLHADEIDAAVIVLGARSRSSIRSLILGDIANEVAQRATRAVLLVPSPPLVERRREALQENAQAQTSV
jgi:nucleotide-binding universal stress UspA family protein